MCPQQSELLWCLPLKRPLMEHFIRLTTISKQLVGTFVKADSQRQRNAACAAPLIGVRKSGVQGKDVDQAVKSLFHGGLGQPDLPRRLEQLSE